MAEQEIWKVFPDYDFIEVSNLGRIRTKDRYVSVRNGGKRLINGRVLKQQLRHDGYMDVNFRVNGKKVHLYVHRAIAICFIPNPLGLPEVNHIDNNPKNNAISNLEWCDHQYNIAYREKYGVPAREATKTLRKPLIAVDLDSFKVLWFESQSEAARQLGADVGHVNSVIKGKRHKTGGCWLCYADETAIEKAREKFGDKIAEKVEKLLQEHQ